MSRLVVYALILGIVLPIQLSEASTGQKLSLEQLAEQADAIVRGRVEETKTRQSSDGAFANTRIVVSVEEQFKGDKISSLTIRLPVGSIGDLVQGAPGTPEFAQGDTVIVFLQRERQQGTYRLVGGKQGKFTAKSEPGSDVKIIEDAARRVESYDRFLDRLSKALKR